MRSPQLYILVASLAAGAVTRPCSAQAQTPTPRADVDALFARAQHAHETNDLAEQLASLRGLNALAPDPRVTCALGMVERRLGQWPEAAEHLTQCVANPPSKPPPGQTMEQWLTNMRGEKAMARAEVGVLTITSPPDAEVAIDGIERGAAAGRELFLEPKINHRIDVRRGPSIQSHVITLGRGTTRNLVIIFPPPPPLGDWLVFGGTMTAGALALGGGVLYIVSVARYSEAELHDAEAIKFPQGCFVPSRTHGHCEAYKSAFNSAGTFRDSALAVWVVAGGIGVTTAIYHVAKPAAPRVTVGLASVRLEGTW